MRVIDLGTRIAPFGDRVGDLPLLGRSFAAFRRREVREAGVEAERLTFADHAFAAAPILRELVRAARPGRTSVLALDAGSPSRWLAPVSSVRASDGLLRFDVFVDAPLDADLPTLREQAEPVKVELPFPTRAREILRVGPPPHTLELPADGAVAAHVEHWVHLLWLTPLLVPRVLAWSGLGPKDSLVPHDATIHRSAHLEGSVVGAGAKIGVKATLDGSYVGAGSHLADFTKLGSSALGEDTHVLADASFAWSVALGQGTLANLLLKDSIVGRHVFLTSGVIFWAERIDGTVTVEHRGQEVDTLRKALGGAAGHGAVLGARTIVAPGRALPNKTTVVMRREEGVLRVEATAPGTPVAWDDAALVPFSRLSSGAPDEIG